MISRPRIFQDTGSMAPLGIGLFAVSLSFVLLLAAAESMFIFQKRLTNYAEMAAIFVVNHDQSIREFQNRVGSQNFVELSLKNKLLEDGRTELVQACATWSPLFSPADIIAPLQICSHASARAG